jgi:ABC-2 type transport system permease protein
MGATLSIFRRELGAYFNTPIGYVIAVFFLLITSFYYVPTLFSTGLADLRGFFVLLPVVLLMFVPAISMRLWAEERKMGTLEVLMTMPVRSWQAVLGKYFAGLAFITFMLALTIHLPIALYCLGNPDTGTILGGYLGSLMLAMVYLSIGSFSSSVTSDQITAFIIAISINGIFFLMGYEPLLDLIKDVSPDISNFIRRFGIEYHFISIARGVVDTRDIVYGLSLTGLFLFLNVLVIERRR